MMEHVFSQTASIELMDGAVCALMAAAAAARSRNFGACMSGCVAIGCICGISGPLLRELILHGQTGAKIVLAALPGEAFAGAAGALISMLFSAIRPARLFFWLDAAGISMAASLAAALGAPELGVVGALVLALACALVPGLIRDVSIGDTAMMLEKPWYASSAAISGCISMLVIILPAFGHMPSIFVERAGEWAVLGGAITGMLVLFWKRDM